MFKIYGLIGILLIIFVEICIFFKIEPIVTWYIPIIWFGYIFVVDAIVYTPKRNSMLCNRPKKFAFALFSSFSFWLLFEFYNIFYRDGIMLACLNQNSLQYFMAVYQSRQSCPLSSRHGN